MQRKSSAPLPLSDKDAEAVKELRKDIGHKLLQARTKAGLTRRQVSDLTGVAQTSIYMIEGGGQNMTVETLWRMTKALGLRLHEMFTETPREPLSRDTLEMLVGLLEQMSRNYSDQLKQENAQRDYLAKRQAEIAAYVQALEDVRGRILASLERGANDKDVSM